MVDTAAPGRPSDITALSKRPGFTDTLAQSYWYIFGRQWPAWLGGVLLGLLNFALFAFAAPWFIYGGFQLAGSWLISFVGIKPAITLTNPLLNASFVENTAIVFGALLSTLAAGQFRIRMPKRKIRLLDGFAGGLLMGFGAMMAPGCNIGGLFTAMAALSLSGFIMLFALGTGAYLGVLLIRFRTKREVQSGAMAANYELQKLPAAAKPKNRWRQPLIALGTLVPLFVWFQITRAHSTPVAVYLLFGLAFGVVLQRAGFCITASFRDMFTVGDGRLARGLIVAVAVAMVGFAILTGAGLRQPFLLPVGWTTMVGGLVFGFGMVLAGGCASGTLFRIGEGSVQLLFALLGGMLGAALTSVFIKSAGITFGKGIWLVDKLGWQGGLLAGLAFLGVWLLVVQWNQWHRRIIR